jgi:hypothetical protein
MPLTTEQIPRLAGLELNALRATEVLGSDYDKLTVPDAGTAIHDLSGPVLYHRLPLARGRAAARGYVDIASHEALGAPLLGTSIGVGWNEAALVKAGSAAARKIKPGIKFDAVRFVAYSHPKIALQFLLKDTELLMLELYTWAVVPTADAAKRADRKPLQPGNFERWSLLDELPEKDRKARSEAFKQRVAAWSDKAFTQIDVRVISPDILRERYLPLLKLVESRELHYSARDTDHHPCYELRGQQTNVWCVGASTEMLLNFYRYQYDQVRLATELGLGTQAHPNGLPYARVGDVVTVIERLSSNSLDATMVTNPGFDLFRSEILANRPLISFVPGHSRTVAGYTRTVALLLSTPTFRGLLVYDPWPPNAGVITRWENFDTQTYQYAYSAVLKHV